MTSYLPGLTSAGELSSLGGFHSVSGERPQSGPTELGQLTLPQTRGHDRPAPRWHLALSACPPALSLINTRRAPLHSSDPSSSAQA